MACGVCGGNHNTNSCCNPCNTVSTTNTAACESLPSQIQNFVDQFFGAIVKTEVNGVVTWSLPCSLEVGLPNNPREAGEGLACYFLRLFSEGIIGLTGPQGDRGTDGVAGRNAYTVTIASFVQPMEGGPVTVVTSANPAILDDLYVFIATSGWYVVNEADPSGVLFLTLVRSLVSAGTTITAGKLVVPSGFPGASVQGPQGFQGPVGPQGPAATAFTTNNDMFFDPGGGTDYDTQVVYAPVTYTSSVPSVLLSAAGRYLVTVVAGVLGLATVATTDKVTFKLRNTTISGDIDGSEKGINNLVVDEEKQVIINVIVETDAVNQTVALFAKATTANKIASVAAATTITYVRIE